MVKIIGAMLVFAAAAGLGNEQAHQVQKRLRALYQCQTLVTLLESQIRYTGADLEECFRELGQRLFGPFREFCLCLADTITNLPGRPFEALWRAASAECLANSGLNKEDLSLFGTVGQAVGYLDCQSQCRHLDNYLERLALEIARAETETRQKSRLYRSLGVCAGAMITLLMI